MKTDLRLEIIKHATDEVLSVPLEQRPAIIEKFVTNSCELVTSDLLTIHELANIMAVLNTFKTFTI